MTVKRFFVEKNNISNGVVTISGGEHNHLKNVMRLSVGTEIIVVVGDEFFYHCQITDVKKNETLAQVIKKEVCKNNPINQITVYQALIKKDNMELVVQKLTELGVSKLVPFENEFTTVRNSENKQDKLQTIANQSIKQCGRSVSMKVESCKKIKEVAAELNGYDIVVFANETENTETLNNLFAKNKYKNAAIIVGSEGGFSKAEIELLIKNGAKSVTLGRRILRAETAAISLTAVVAFLMGEWYYAN